MKMYASAEKFIEDASYRLQYLSSIVHPDTWQSMDVSKKPEMATHEVLNFSGSFVMPTTRLDYYQKMVQPNLPWADVHFETERVSGQPINPGESWRIWPWGNSADKFRKADQQFEHTYAERYWPKWAGRTPWGTLEGMPEWPADAEEHRGIRFKYGDLMDVVNLLIKHPLTRQAYLPIWFPEDTGVNEGQRVPCSLGYHFIRRGDHLHIGYWLRSCDFYRHFRDDVYLTIRLLLWVLDRLQSGGANDWMEVKPGIYSMWVTSLHLFVNDYKKLYGNKDSNPGG